MATTTFGDLELRHLHALVAVTEEGTFSRAAARLGYTQSAVSQQIAALERMVDTPLFDRPGGPRPVELTEAGRTLVDHARGVLNRIAVAQAELAAISAGDQGTVRLGTVQSVGTRVLPDLLARFRKRRPGVEVVLRESPDVRELLDAVADGELDVTFTELVTDPRFAYRSMLDDPFVLVAPKDSPQAELPAITVEQMSGLPMIGYRGDMCRTVVEVIFEGTPGPEFVFRSDDNPTIQRCVALGIGYWATPLLTVDVADAAVVALPIEPEPTPRHIAMAWPVSRRTSTAVMDFVALAEDVCRAVEAGFPEALRRA